MTRARPLSSAPRPLDDAEGPEAFASYVDRLAAGQVIPAAISTILKDTGLLAEDRFDARVLPGYGIDLTPVQLEAFAQSCRLTPAEVRRMLLRDLDGVAFDLTGLDVKEANSVRQVAQREWAGFAGSACCPACLAETGGWRLRWRLWTSFVCLTHGRLLAARCPRCHHRTGNYRADQGNRPRFMTHAPVPGRCANSLPAGLSAQGRGAQPCGFDLRTLETEDLSRAPRLLTAQHMVNRVLEERRGIVAGRPVDALVYVRHLRSLVALALHAAAPGDLGELPETIAGAWRDACEARDDLRASELGVRGTALHPYKAAPADPRLVAAILPWAVELLASPDQAEVTAGLAPLVRRSQGIRRSAVRALGRDFHLEGPLAVALSQTLASRALTHRTVGHLAPEGTGSYRTFRSEHVPHLIWQQDYRDHFSALLHGSGLTEQAARVVISMALVRLTGQFSVQRSAELLELGDLFRGSSTGPLMTHLARTDQKAAFAQALHALATRLEAPGPHRDYRAAQRSLTGFSALSPEDWASCRQAVGGGATKTAGRRRNAAAWIWSQALSSHPHFSPALTTAGLHSASAREVYRRFEAQDLPRLQPALTSILQRVEARLPLSPGPTLAPAR